MAVGPDQVPVLRIAGFVHVEVPEKSHYSDDPVLPRPGGTREKRSRKGDPVQKPEYCRKKTSRDSNLFNEGLGYNGSFIGIKMLEDVEAQNQVVPGKQREFQ